MNCTFTKTIPLIPERNVQGNALTLIFDLNDDTLRIESHPPFTRICDPEKPIKATKEQIDFFKKIFEEILATQSNIKNVEIKTLEKGK